MKILLMLLVVFAILFLAALLAVLALCAAKLAGGLPRKEKLTREEENARRQAEQAEKLFNEGLANLLNFRVEDAHEER